MCTHSVINGNGLQTKKRTPGEYMNGGKKEFS